MGKFLLDIWHYLFGVPPTLLAQQKDSFYPWPQDLCLSMKLHQDARKNWEVACNLLHKTSQCKSKLTCTAVWPQKISFLDWHFHPCHKLQAFCTEIYAYKVISTRDIYRRQCSNSTTVKLSSRHEKSKKGNTESNSVDKAWMKVNKKQTFNGENL